MAVSEALSQSVRSRAHGRCQYCLMHESLQGATFHVEDPLTGEQVPLFHPVRQQWSEHFRFKGYALEGLTATGRATVAMLDLNHLRRQRIRQVEEAFGLYPPTP